MDIWIFHKQHRYDEAKLKSVISWQSIEKNWKNRRFYFKLSIYFHFWYFVYEGDVLMSGSLCHPIETWCDYCDNCDMWHNDTWPSICHGTMIWRWSTPAIASISLLLMEKFSIGATFSEQEIKPNEWIDCNVKLRVSTTRSPRPVNY